MTIDPNKIKAAKEWAADIDADRETLSQDTIDAAADLISSLPDAWVGVDELRKYISDWREGLATAPRGNYEGEMLDDLEDMLPAPTPPTLADMTPEERGACVGMWCDNLASTAQEPVPVVLACVQGEQCWILHTNLHGEWSCFPLDSVSPRPDIPRAWSQDGTPVSATGDQVRAARQALEKEQA